ncbi:hypothetical protein [Sinomonas halotolerans]|uniref:DNA modification methylase n=1 Tax=Sinomonas halotolerans TaxID=1644133 RepID=A0ABU9X0G9_9MICC
MRFTASKPAKRVALIAALGVGLLSATGCGYINAQQTTHKYAASDGIVADLGPLQLRNVLVVSSGRAEGSEGLSADAPGRLLGTVFNTSAQEVALTFSDAGTPVRLDIPANGEVNLGEEGMPIELSESGAIPGGLAPIEFTAAGTSKELSVPVLDGALAEYREYLPSSAATPSATATPSESGDASHAGGETEEASSGH